MSPVLRTPSPDADVREPTGRWELDAPLVHYRIGILEDQQKQFLKRVDAQTEAFNQMALAVNNLKVSYGFIGTISAIVGAVTGTLAGVMAVFTKGQ